MKTDYITHSFLPQTLEAWTNRLSAIERQVDVHGTVLDLGCGTGALCSLLVTQSLRVFGGDSKCDFLREFRNRVPGANAIQLDVANLPIRSNIADFIFSVTVLSYVQREYWAWLEMARVLRRGGHAYIRVQGPGRIREFLAGSGTPLLYRVAIVCLIAVSTAIAQPCGYRWKPTLWSNAIHTRASLNRISRAVGFEIVTLSTADRGRMYDLIVKKK
jgi:SAM-dependent methyltransferase